jgi:glycine dehydrogenase subunit 2
MSVPGRSAYQLRSTDVPSVTLSDLIPAGHLAERPVEVAEVSERDLVAHFTRLSHRQFAVDLGAYPLGSCTMKYNPKFCDSVAADPGWNAVHPATPAAQCQGWLALMVELEEKLCVVTGMAAATLQPAAGAAGELTGLLLMRAYARLSWGSTSPCHHSRLSSRHEPRLGDAGWLRSHNGAFRRTWAR